MPIDIPEIPNHTQSCEYHIQALTETVTKVAGIENQEGHLKNKLNHRRRMGKQRYKNDYLPL